MTMPASYYHNNPVVNNQVTGWLNRTNPYGSTWGSAATNPAPGPPPGAFVNGITPLGNNWNAIQLSNGQTQYTLDDQQQLAQSGQMAQQQFNADMARNQAMYGLGGRTLSQPGPYSVGTGSSVTSVPQFGAMAKTAPNVQPQPFLYNHGVPGYAPPTGPSNAPRAPVGPQPYAMTRPVGDDQQQGVGPNPYTPPTGGLGGGTSPNTPHTTNPPPSGGLGGGVTTPTTPLPTNAPGGYGTNPGSPSFGAINTSINPTDIYSPQDTQRAIHTQQALAAQAGSLPWLLRQFARPGMSQRSASAVGRAIPTLGMLQSEIAQAPVAMQFADDAANIDHRRSGEIAREQEAQGLAGGLLRLQDINRVLQGTQGSILSSLLQQYI